MEAPPNPTPGFYGKLPSHGDFLVRRLPRTFVDPWDAWLQTCLQGSRERLGDAWAHTWQAGPVWHFALGAGVCGSHCWAGMMLPSADRVGRQFPFTMAGGEAGDAPLFRWLAEGVDWYGDMEELALTVRAGGMSLEALELELAAMPSHPTFAPPNHAGNGAPNQATHQATNQATNHAPNGVPGLAFGGDATTASVASGAAGGIDVGTASGAGWRLALGRMDLLPLSAPGLTADVSRLLLRGHSLWWSAGSDLVAPSLLVCQGLPDVARYCGMLDGNWRQAGWQAGWQAFGQEQG